jgi:hypothetical protein
LLNRPPQIGCDFFLGAIDNTTTTIGAMHPEIDKLLNLRRQLCIVSRSLTLGKRSEIEQDGHALRKISG